MLDFGLTFSGSVFGLSLSSRLGLRHTGSGLSVASHLLTGTSLSVAVPSVAEGSLPIGGAGNIHGAFTVGGSRLVHHGSCSVQGVIDSIGILALFAHLIL